MKNDVSSSNSSTSISGGVSLDAERINIGGDVVGRDKIITNIQNIDQRARTAAEEAEQAREFEAQRLAQGVSTYAQRLQARAGEATDVGKGGPYKGLLEYRLSDAEIFFGRDRAIHELLEHLQRSPLTVLHAESGAGKTSLLQAGISPRLIAAGHLPIYLRPYNSTPSLAVKRAFLPNLNDTPNLAQAPLRDFLSRVSNMLGTVTTLYIFLDQFEEFFTQLEEAARPEFVRELAECLEDESLNVRWVLALRSEFFGNLASFRPRVRNPFENDYRLNRLTRDEAREAVAKPAARRGISFEDGLIDTILNDLGKDEVEPPQVQLVCSTLYETLPADAKVITREMYATLGGAAGILREHLGRVLKRDLPAEQRSIAQRLLEELITSDIRRVIRTHSELATTMSAQSVKRETLDTVLGQLVDSRLLRVEETEGEPTYELAHDYLLGEIKLDPAVQARKAAQELLDQEVRAYQRHATLLSDDKLAIIEARRGELVLNDDATTLIRKSERALKRRQRVVFGGIGLVIVLFIVGTLSVLSAIGAQSAADQARKQQATSEAGAAAATTREAIANQAAVVAATNEAHANESAATATAREVMAKETLRHVFERSGIVPVGSNPVALVYDGTRVWVANADGNTVQAIDPETGEVGMPVKVDAFPAALAYDGMRVWVANSISGTVQAIDPLSGKAGTPIKVGNNPNGLIYDGARLWVANWSDETVQAVDPTTGDVGKPIEIGFNPTVLTYDGSLLWAANTRGGFVQAIDPTTGGVSILLTVLGTGPTELVYDGARLWLANNGDGTVQAVNPATGSVVAPIPVGNGPAALIYDGARLWVANSRDGTVQVFDPVTHYVGAPVPVGTNPTALAYDGARLWVANADDDTVQAITPATGEVGVPVKVGYYPQALIYDGVRLWVANYGSGTVQTIDSTTGATGAPINVGTGPWPLAYDGMRVWVANWDDGTVQAIDPTTGKVGTPIRVGTHPNALVYDGARLWVANRGNGTVQAIDPATGNVTGSVKVGTNPWALAYDGASLWVVNNGDRTVQAIDPATGNVGTSVSVGTDPVALVYDGARLWVANRGDDTVQAIDPDTDKAGVPIKVSFGPNALAFADDRLWVANWADGTVQAIDPETSEVGEPIKVGTYPNALAYDGARLWVANWGDNTVQYILP